MRWFSWRIRSQAVLSCVTAWESNAEKLVKENNECFSRHLKISSTSETYLAFKISVLPREKNFFHRRSCPLLHRIIVVISTRNSSCRIFIYRFKDLLEVSLTNGLAKQTSCQRQLISLTNKMKGLELRYGTHNTQTNIFQLSFSRLSRQKSKFFQPLFKGKRKNTLKSWLK